MFNRGGDSSVVDDEGLILLRDSDFDGIRATSGVRDKDVQRIGFGGNNFSIEGIFRQKHRNAGTFIDSYAGHFISDLNLNRCRINNFASRDSLVEHNSNLLASIDRHIVDFSSYPNNAVLAFIDINGMFWFRISNSNVAIIFLPFNSPFVSLKFEFGGSLLNGS